MKPNTSYGVRPVRAEEIAALCGSAARALEITGGSETLALHFIHNPEAIATAGPVAQMLTGLGSDLRVLRDTDEATKKVAEREKKEAERREVALTYWRLHNTIAAVMKAVGCGRETAKRLIAGDAGKRVA